MLIRSTRDFSNKQLKMVVYGSPGVGKTSLAKTCGGKVLVISAEGGLLSLSDNDIDFVDITMGSDGQILAKSERLEALRAAFEYVQTEEARKKYSWLFVDSLTEIGQIVIENLKTKYPEKKDALPMWGEYSDQMRALIKSFRDLPGYNVVFTALTTTEKDENARRYQAVDLQGKISSQLPGYFDEVFYFHVYEDSETGETKRGLITQPNEKVVAKDRSGKLALMEEPHLGKISDKIRGSKLQESKTN